MAKKIVQKSKGAVLDRKHNELELEVVSTSARLKLTRLLRAATKAFSRESDDAHQVEIIRQNRFINFASAVLGRPIYVLEMSDWDYAPAEYAWHQAELELVMRRPDTPQLAELLADIVNDGGLAVEDINEILETDRCGFRLEEKSNGVSIELLKLPDLQDDAGIENHPNIRQLFERMDRAMQDGDWSLVLHTGASIFETLAKQVVTNQNVQNQSLGSWFSLYRNHSKLAKPLLDAIEEVFKRRNVEPLAGHGSVQNPAITQEEAEQVRVLTHALVRLERSLSSLTVPPIINPVKMSK